MTSLAHGITAFRKQFAATISAVPTTTPGYCPPMGQITALGATLGRQAMIVTEAGTLKNMRGKLIFLQGDLAGEDTTVTLMVNGVASAFEFVVTAGDPDNTTYTDTDTINVAAGDYLEWRLTVATGALGGFWLALSMDFEVA